MAVSGLSACRSSDPRPAPGIGDGVADFFRRRSMRPVYEPYPVYRPTYNQPTNGGGPALNGYAGFNYPPLFGGRAPAGNP